MNILFCYIINAAAKNWVNPGVGTNPINMTAVSSNKGTHIDVYAKSFPYNNSYASTSWWSADGLGMSSQSTSNYFYTEIMINKSKSISTYVLIHETGHCFGLDHNSSRNSVMYKDDSANVRTVQSCDNQTINYLY